MSFIRLDNTEVTRSSIIERMIMFYKERYGEDLTEVCDLADGSEMRTLLESIAVEIYDLYYQDDVSCRQAFVKTAVGYYLDMKGCEFHLTRSPSAQSTGYLNFSFKSGPITVDYTIPQGLMVLDRKTGNEYYTTSSMDIKAGELEVDVPAISVLEGLDYNCETGRLTAFKNMSQVRGDLQVTNKTAFTGGRNAESDEHFRQRILEAMKSEAFGTVQSYTNALENIEGIHDVAFINPKDVTDHLVGGKRCTACTRVCYINSSNKTKINNNESTNNTNKPVDYESADEDMLFKVTNYFTNQDNLVIGHSFHVSACNCRRLYFKIEAYTSLSNIDTDEIMKALRTYFDGGTYGGMIYPGLGIGEAVRMYGLIDVLERVPGIEQVVNILNINYRTTYPENAKWEQLGNETDWVWTDSMGFTYRKATKDGKPSAQWGERRFRTLTVPVNYVAYLDSMKNSSQDSNSPDILFESIGTVPPTERGN